MRMRPSLPPSLPRRNCSHEDVGHEAVAVRSWPSLVHQSCQERPGRKVGVEGRSGMSAPSEALEDTARLATEGSEESASEKKATLFKIGAVAQSTGVSERTLRYYEELGLVNPADHCPGASRLYSEADVERVRHIRRLQSLMGLNLEEIRDFIAAEDRLAELKAHYASAPPEAKRRDLEEALSTLESMRSQVASKLKRLSELEDELAQKAKRYREVLESQPQT
jgi:DNA-binding transcriptional MerR regulator